LGGAVDKVEEVDRESANLTVAEVFEEGADDIDFA
jgi:hypothetical protein